MKLFFFVIFRWSILVQRSLSHSFFLESSVEFNTPARNEYSEPSTAPIRNDYHSSIATSTPLPPTPSAGRGRPKGSSSLKTSKSKSSKASASFAIDPDKKSQIFDNQSNINDLHVVQNVIHTVDEQVINSEL